MMEPRNYDIIFKKMEEEIHAQNEFLTEQIIKVPDDLQEEIKAIKEITESIDSEQIVTYTRS